MADINRQKLRAILQEQTTGCIKDIWANTLNNDKDLMIDELLQLGDYELTQALRRYNWDFHIKEENERNTF